VWSASAGHEYFPNLPPPKGFNHDLLRIAAAKGFRMMGASQSRIAARNTHTDLATFREDLGALKPDVVSLIEHMKSGDEIDRAGEERHFLRRVAKNRPSIGAPR
jgi:hypothetical protein